MFLVLGLILAGVSALVIAPRLDALTGGALTTRYSRTDLSGREDLMKGDSLVFLAHPGLGVGVGLARQARREMVGKSAKSHTEFTRLLSEHGILGLAALGLLLTMGIRAVALQTPGWPRAFSAALVVFALIFMSGSGMRMAIPSFLLGLAAVRIDLSQLSRMSQPRANGDYLWQKGVAKR